METKVIAVQFRGTVYENGYGQIAQKVMRDTTISRDAKAIYAYLCSLAGGNFSDDRKAWPSVRTMMNELGFKSRDTFYKHRKQLIEKGYITVEQHKTEDGKFTRNVYYIEAVISPKTSNEAAKSPCTKKSTTVKPYPNFSTPENSTPENQDTTIYHSTNTNKNKNNNNTASKTETAYKQDNDRESHSANVVVVDPILAFAKQHNLRLSEKVLVKWRKKTDDTMILLYLTHAVLDEKVKNKIAWITTAIEEGFDLSVPSEVAATSMSQEKKKPRSAYIEKLRRAGAR